MAILLSSVVVLAGCSSGGSDSASEPTAVEPTSSPDGHESEESRPHGACDLLSEDELTELAGQRLPAPTRGITAGLPSCQWGSPGSMGVQVASVPAAQWSEQVPALLEQLQGSGLMADPRNQAKLQAARRMLESGNASRSAGACDLFGLLLEIQGLTSTATRTVNIVPSRADPQLITGQACSRGTFTSVLLVAPDLKGSGEEVNRVADALTQAHDRAAK